MDEKKLLTKLKYEKESYNRWKLGQVTWKDYGDAIRDGVRKTKTYPDLNLVRGVKGNKKGFHRYISNKIKTREDVGSLLNEGRDLVLKDIKRAEVLNGFFTLVFCGKTCLQESQTPETRGNVWTKEDLLLVEKDQVREYLNIYAKSVRSDEIHPGVLRELVDVIARLLLVIFEKPCAEEVSKGWKKPPTMR